MKRQTKGRREEKPEKSKGKREDADEKIPIYEPYLPSVLSMKVTLPITEVGANIKANLEKLIVSKDYRDEYTKNSTNLIDLGGTRRILNEIISL